MQTGYGQTGTEEKRRRQNVVRALFALFTVLLAAFALAACGGGDSDTTTTANGTEAETAAEESGDSSAAADLVAAASAEQTEWTGPEESPKPVKGKKIGVVPCGMAIEGCARQARGAEAAGKVLGWQTTIVDGEGDQQKIADAISSLINQKVDAIYLGSVNAEAAGEQVQRAADNGIAVIASFASDPQQFGGIGEVGIDDFEAGRVAAAFMASQGGGGLVLFDQRESPAVAERADGLKAGIEEFGEVEIVEEQSIPNTQLGEPSTQLMSSILQRNPEGVDWIYAGFDFMLTTMIQAIDRAGRSEGIQGVSFDGNTENLQFIADGNVQAASIGYPLEWAAWAAMDQLNRHFQDEPLVDNPGIEFKLLTKDNLPEGGKGWTGDLDYQAKYRELWGL